MYFQSDWLYTFHQYTLIESINIYVFTRQPYKNSDIDRMICLFQCSKQHQNVMNEVWFIYDIMRSQLKKSSDFVWLVYLNDALNEKVKVTLLISIDK